MDEKRACDTCRSWHADTQGDEGRSGDCRNLPPVIVASLIPRPYNPEDPWLAVHEATFFPRTWADEWCGLHQSREPNAPAS